MRSTAFLLVLALTSCGWLERERDEAARAAAEAARAETLAEVESMLAEAVRRADHTAGAADRILSPMPVMTPAEENGLRRFLGGTHVAEARRVGVRVGTEQELESLVATGRLVRLPDSTQHFIVRERTSPAYVVPAMQALLETLGARFQARLAELELPPYRIEVTSALRTSDRQERLRRSNSNAATGVSSHEFGATVDLSYAAFAPPAERPLVYASATPEPLRPHLERLVDLALESVSARKSRELGKIFSAVLAEAQAEGLALVIYERQQTIYHVTVSGGMARP
jgi:hypothetical protein